MEYRPLSEKNHEIRLLILVRGDDSASVYCEMDHYSLINHPPYTTLSYHWGNPENTKTVMINGTEGDSKIWADALCINQSDMEERSRQVLRMRTIYAEANLVVAWLGLGDESSKLAMKFINNVTQMKTGFQNPFDFEEGGTSMKEETKFLGVMNQFGKMAVGLMNHWPERGFGNANPIHDESDKHSGSGVGKENSPQGIPELNMFDEWFEQCGTSNTIVENIEFEDDETRKAVIGLFSCSYWRRVWIIQEISVASEVLVFYGVDHTSLENIEIVLARTSVGKDLLTRGLVPDFQAFRKSSFSGHAASLVKLLISSRASLATDPRDKVYGILGLAADGEQLVPVPDYDESLQNILRKMTVSILQKRRYLNILLFRDPDRAPDERLPSWVPDWAELSRISKPWHLSLAGPDNDSISARQLQNGLKQFLAPLSGWMEDSVRPPLNFCGQQILKVKGRMVDEVVDNSLQFPGEEIRTNEECGHQQRIRSHEGLQNLDSDSYDFTLEIAKCITMAKIDFGMDSESFSEALDCLFSRNEALIESFSMLLDKEHVDYITETHPNLLPWLSKVKSLIIRGKTFEDWVKEANRFTASSPPQSNSRNIAFYKYLKRLTLVVDCKMTLATLKKGRVAMVYPQTQSGDVICTLFGCDMHVILRESRTLGESYHVVGEAYIHDMYGIKDFSWTSLGENMNYTQMLDIRIE